MTSSINIDPRYQIEMYLKLPINSIRLKYIIEIVKYIERLKKHNKIKTKTQ